MGDDPVYPMTPPHPDEGTSAYSQNVTCGGPVKTTRSAPQTPAVAQIGERKAKTELQRNKARSKPLELAELDQQWTADWETEGVRHQRQGTTPTVHVTAAVVGIQSDVQDRATLREGHADDGTPFWQQMNRHTGEMGEEPTAQVTAEAELVDKMSATEIVMEAEAKLPKGVVTSAKMSMAATEMVMEAEAGLMVTSAKITMAATQMVMKAEVELINKIGATEMVMEAEAELIGKIGEFKMLVVAMVEAGFRWQDDAPRFCALEECACIRVIGERLEDCACIICKQGQGNQGLRWRVEQLEQQEAMLAVAPPDAEAQSAKLASELVAHVVADAAEASTPASDKPTAPVTTQKAAEESSQPSLRALRAMTST